MFWFWLFCFSNWIFKLPWREIIISSSYSLSDLRLLLKFLAYSSARFSNCSPALDKLILYSSSWVLNLSLFAFILVASLSYSCFSLKVFSSSTYKDSNSLSFSYIYPCRLSIISFNSIIIFPYFCYSWSYISILFIKFLIYSSHSSTLDSNNSFYWFHFTSFSVESCC
jgi:hypothetical protein